MDDTTADRPPVPLRQDTLDRLPDGVHVPHYDRAALRRRVLHFGVGGFHRAHQAAFLDALAEQGVSDWGVVGVGLHHREMKEVLSEQDHLYSVVERGPERESVRVIGAMVDYLFGPEDGDAILDLLASPELRLVTLTITGTGYRLGADGTFDTSDPAVAEDLGHPERPGTVFGFLVEGLRRRRDAGAGPISVLSCDNMQHNGHAARTATVAFARAVDPALADWIDAEVAFPSSMVDRITPETTPEEQARIAARTGVDDRWPVITEPFLQWVVEDAFVAGRPPLERAGVQMVPDVAPYEHMKTRLLNGSHSALCYLGALAGHRTTAEVVADPVFHAFLEHLMAEEVAPHLPEVPGIDLAQYQRTLLERFANPRIADDLQRLCRRGSTKVPTYVLPSVRAALENGTRHDLLTLAVAGWMRYLRGVDYAGEPVPVEGPMEDALPRLAVMGGSNPRQILRGTDLFGDLADDEGFVRALTEALLALDGDGPREVVESYLARVGASADSTGATAEVA